jgi:hypothetical protein
MQHRSYCDELSRNTHELIAIEPDQRGLVCLDVGIDVNTSDDYEFLDSEWGEGWKYTVSVVSTDSVTYLYRLSNAPITVKEMEITSSIRVLPGDQPIYLTAREDGGCTWFDDATSTSASLVRFRLDSCGSSASTGTSTSLQRRQNRIPHHTLEPG